MAKTTVNVTPTCFEAAIDDATMARMEKGAQAKARGQQRRCALLATARDSQTLLKMAKDCPDAAIEVSRDGDRREWRVAKSKDGQDGDAHPFKLQIETLAVDDQGDPVTSCVVLPDHAAQDVRAVKLPQGGNQRLVLDALRPMFKDGATGKPGAPPLVHCVELEAAVTAGAGRLTCQTDRRATRTREAITGLVSRGVLGLNEGWLWMN